MAPVDRTNAVHAVFKTVAGILNGAYTEDRIRGIESETQMILGTNATVTMELACDALALGIESGLVPPRGVETAHALVEASEKQYVSVRLCTALGIRPIWMLSKAQETLAAQALFRFFTGVLTGAVDGCNLETVQKETQEMLETDLPVTILSVCDALACAIERGCVPEESVEIVRLLVESQPTSCSVSDRLCNILGVKPHVAHHDAETEASLEDVEPFESLTPQAASDAEVLPEYTEAEQKDAAHKLFKVVSGVLNGVYSVDSVQVVSCQAEICIWCPGASADFQSLCDALGAVIRSGMVPDQGLAVLTKLAPNMRDQGLTTESMLATALNVNLDKPDSKRAARRIFTYVMDVLKNSCSSAPSPEDVGVWYTPTCGACFADDVDSSFIEACEALAAIVVADALPAQPLWQLVQQSVTFPEFDLMGSALEQALLPHLCPACKVNPPTAPTCLDCRGTGNGSCVPCKSSGKYRQPCRRCHGTGKVWTRRYCPVCDGTGLKVLGDCRECKGSGKVPCLSCDMNPEHGIGRPLCHSCTSLQKVAAARRREQQQQQQQNRQRGNIKNDGPPEKGVSIEPCPAGELTRLNDLWTHRGGSGSLIGAWKVDNPLLTYEFKQRRETLQRILGREADILEGFHGTAPVNVLSIIGTGFDKSKRGSAVGLVHGAGEYFAKDPTISLSFCRGGQFMLVCRLTLGIMSSTGGNGQQLDGDHNWVPSYGGSGCYVIQEPSQILPEFIVQFSSGGGATCPKLEKALSEGYSTKPPPPMVPIPFRQRDCKMSRPEAIVLWMGFLHAHFDDDSLRKDVHRFLMKHAAKYMAGSKIQIVKGYYKKAHVILDRATPIPRDLVHKLNTAPFIEQGTERTICVEDAHGSPGTECPRYIAGYCRGQNLRFTHPCFCSHPERPTKNAKFTLTPIGLDSAKGTEICDKFMASAPFHTGYPTIVGIKAINNPVLSRCHEEYRKFLMTKHMKEPAEQELYHGTNNNINEVLYQHGLQPPSDTNASDSCPVSGGKGLCTTLCDNTCKYCVQKHEWKRCHMYGLGIYLADMAQKSHRYISQPKTDKRGRTTYRMIVCSVLGKSFQIEGHLKDGQGMHDVVNVRALDEEELDNMIEPCAPAPRTTRGVGASIQGVDGSLWGRVIVEDYDAWRLHTGRIAKKSTEGSKWNWCITEECSADNREGTAEKSDLLFVKGLGSRTRVGYSVVNSEYIAFHPHQCLPKYEIEYEIR